LKAELNIIDTQKLAEELSKAVIKALKPLLKDREGDTLFTVKGLAKYLEVSEKWVYERVQFKEIPYCKVGGNLRFKRSAIDDWLETLKTPPVNPLSGPLKMVK
jgi:excisionase family DNA binding protein